MAIRYKELFDSKKIQAINDELLLLEGKKSQSLVGTEKVKIDKMSLAAKEYGLGRNTIARLIRINELSSELKAMVDEERIKETLIKGEAIVSDARKSVTESVVKRFNQRFLKIRPAVELSYLSRELQDVVYTIIDKNNIETVDMKTAKQLRDISESYAEPSLGVIEEALLGEREEQPQNEKAYKVSVSQAAYTRYLENVPKKDIGGIIEKALEMYFESVETE